MKREPEVRRRVDMGYHRSLADEFWLAAHDGVKGQPRLGPWALGVGLATALLAELVYGGHLQLYDGELFRSGADGPDDPALRSLLSKMQSEEQSWAPPDMPVDVPVRPREGWQAAASYGRHGYARTPERSVRTSPLRAAPDGALMPPTEETRHRRRGHRHEEWLSYLAYQGRGEALVADRLSRLGLAVVRQERRLLGGTTTSLVPRDSVVSGTPANRLSIAVQSRARLGRDELFLAALILATGLHLHAFATLDPADRSYLSDLLRRDLDEPSRELLRAADAAVGEAAMR
ncbi:GPP34 family phosphoprotein [Paractinoplanes brasiliensis]|uniref:Golgi phosphoprotein 3 GPP34 n=1 Tax=Paractinoplanes brasiliensis TaxID=52695 RepID=A0A4R6JQH1_9ACTN|nr:GPP34 family phosphoprotein [Actinoplanes brasiliensis]TDO38237.1 Golgi phosphoprotein 3 GPP34 [Actinoplanes brasiliensis]